MSPAAFTILRGWAGFGLASPVWPRLGQEHRLWQDSATRGSSGWPGLRDSCVQGRLCGLPLSSRKWEIQLLLYLTWGPLLAAMVTVPTHSVQDGA